MTTPARPMAEIVPAAAAGDGEAWDVLVDRFTGLLWAVARGFRLDNADAADVVQTTWLRLLEHLDRITEPEHLGAWLATTARRECLRALRRAGREFPVEDDGLDRIDSGPPVDVALLVAERDAELWRAFERLPDRCRALLRVLVADPPPTYDEVSAALGMPIGSIGPTRARCLTRLRGLVESAGITGSGGGSVSGGPREAPGR